MTCFLELILLVNYLVIELSHCLFSSKDSYFIIIICIPLTTDGFSHWSTGRTHNAGALSRGQRLQIAVDATQGLVSHKVLMFLAQFSGCLLFSLSDFMCFIEICRTRVYLHKGCQPPLIHRDAKTGNILLSERMEAKIAEDFGLSKIPWSWLCQSSHFFNFSARELKHT